MNPPKEIHEGAEQWLSEGGILIAIGPECDHAYRFEYGDNLWMCAQCFVPLLRSNCIQITDKMYFVTPGQSWRVVK